MATDLQGSAISIVLLAVSLAVPVQAQQDKSIFYFGPEAPAGKECNWVQNRFRQGLAHAVPPLRSGTGLVRQDLAAE
jgi:hypothetical protein